MSFNWRDYISLAEDLVNSTEEARLRSCISRAYYGVFCIARNRKGYKGSNPKKGENLHWIVINAYKESTHVEEQKIGWILDKLRRSRNNADYEGDRPISKGVAERSVNEANQILGYMAVT